MTTVREIIESIKELKPISPVAVGFLADVDQDHKGISEIAALINQDPALAANILRTVNSAYYGLPRKIDSLHDAVTILGSRQIAELVLMHSVAGQLAPQTLDGYGLAKGELWEKAVVGAEVAKMIATDLNHPEVDRIFTAALLRDIGMIALDQVVSKEVDQIRAMIAEKKIGFIDAEKAVVGIDHTKLGAILCRNWSFPESIAVIIERHHDEDITMSDHSEIAIVQAADTICSMIGVGAGADGFSYKVSPGVSGSLTEQQIEALVGKTIAFKSRILSRITV